MVVVCASSVVLPCKSAAVSAAAADVGAVACRCCARVTRSRGLKRMLCSTVLGSKLALNRMDISATTGTMQGKIRFRVGCELQLTGDYNL